MDSERISALCVTRGNPVLLERAIRCFRQQTHEDKELVIVYDVVSHELQRLQAEAAPNEKWVFEHQERPSWAFGDPIAVKNTMVKHLGYLRNVSLENATGTYVMQWDDDDWSHPSRMESQLCRLKECGVDGLMLRRWIVWNAKTDQGYLSFDRPRGWEGSILMRRECALQLQYPNTPKGEDSQFIARFNTRFKLRAVDDQLRWMYVYIYHGGNTWDWRHFEGIFKSSDKLPPETCEYIRRML